jgi:hypothetical protein
LEFLGIQMLTWHDFVVELHTGVVVFVVLAIALRVVVDVGQRGKGASARAVEVRQGTDFVAYAGSVAAVVFLIASGITGYLILPYSTLSSQAIYLNKAFVALAALFFWGAFAFLRYWTGPAMWERRGLYALALVTAFFGLLFTTLAGSIGAELSIGQSVLTPAYNALSINFKQLTLQPVDVALTAAVLIIAIIVVAFLPSRKGSTETRLKV